MSRQPAQDSQTERGLPTHVPPVQGVSRLWSHSALPEDTGIAGRGGGLVYSSGLLPRSLSLYEQGGGAGQQTNRSTGSSMPLNGRERAHGTVARGPGTRTW